MSRLYGRIPQMSRPFVRAAFWDAVALAFLHGMGLPFYGVVARRLGAGDGAMAILAMAPFLGFLGSMRIARLARHVGWSRLLGYMRLSCCCMLLGFAVTTHPVLFTLLATVIIAVVSSSTSLTGNLLRGHVRSTFQGDTLKWMRVTTVLTAVPLTWMAGNLFDVDVATYRIIFPLAGVIAAGTTLFLFRLPRRSMEHAFQRVAPLRFGEEFHLLKRDRRFGLFLLVFFIGTFAEKMGMPVLPVYFTDVLNLRYSDVAAALGIAGPLASIGGYFMWSHIARRTGNPLLVLAICMTLKAIRPAALALAMYASQPVVVVASAEAIFRFMIAGLEIASLLSVLRLAPADRTPHYLGLHFWFMGVRGIMGPIIGWWFLVMNISMSIVFGIITLIVLIGAAGLWLLLAQAKVQTSSDSVQ